MKKLGIILLLAGTVAFGQNKKTGWEAAKLKGKVKTYRIMDYHLDDQGNPFKGNSEFFSEFNPEGRVIKMRVDNEGNVFSYEDTYNDQGLLVESVSKDDDKKTISTNLYEYDKEGNRIRHDVFTAEGNLFMSTFSKYNDKKQLIEKSNCIAGNCDEKTTYSYDKKGYLVQEEKYNKDGLFSKSIYKNDQNGNPLEKLTYDAQGNLVRKVTSKYDSVGNEIENISYKEDGSVNEKRTYQLEYDKQKNWVKKTEQVNGETTQIIVQEFEYYK